MDTLRAAMLASGLGARESIFAALFREYFRGDQQEYCGYENSKKPT